MIIGITGKSGSGKSTVAKFLKSKLNNAYIIAVDKIVISLIMLQREFLICLFGENIIKNNKIDTILFTEYPEKTKVIFEIINEDLKKILFKEIKEQLKNYNYILVDFFRLPILKEVWNLCDYHILVQEISDKKRYENILTRYNNSKKTAIRKIDEEFRLRDYHNPNYDDFVYDFNIINKYDEMLINEVEIIAHNIIEGEMNRT